MNERIAEESEELIKKTINISRVSKVVKGGKRMAFSALCVVGDGDGRVGIAKSKGADVRIAVDKAFRKAEENMKTVNLNGLTIPHTIVGRHCRSFVLMKPARSGTGIIAGASVRAVVEACGINDILTKVHGSTNPINVAYAAMDGLLNLSKPKGKNEAFAESASGG
ncbi:MAG: 30S ribosomal protein S5 [Elusimicrobia bacterium]|nr:30S ribosomal protein S5 [Elusimicrobiota bacterium]